MLTSLLRKRDEGEPRGRGGPPHHFAFRRHAHSRSARGGSFERPPGSPCRGRTRRSPPPGTAPRNPVAESFAAHEHRSRSHFQIENTEQQMKTLFRLIFIACATTVLFLAGAARAGTTPSISRP